MAIKNRKVIKIANFKEFDNKFTDHDYQFLLNKLCDFYASQRNYYPSNLFSRYLYQFIKEKEIEVNLTTICNYRKTKEEKQLSSKKYSSISEVLYKTDSFIFFHMFYSILDEMPLSMYNGLDEIKIISIWRLEIGK